MPAVIVHGTGLMDAIRMSYRFTVANFMWVLTFYALILAIATPISVLLYIPILGWIGFGAFMVALITFQLKIYRAAHAHMSPQRAGE